MKTAFLTGIRQLEIRDVPEPKIINPDDVLIRIDVVGVCGSDVHYYKTGRIGSLVVEFPFPVGHECAGEVVRVGPEVTGIEVGQRVVVDPLINCGRCDQCLTGRPHTCRRQKFLGCPGQAPGSLSEYYVMPARCCYPVPDSVTQVQAVLCEPLSIGVYAAHLAGQAEGKKAAILGSGPIGLCALLALRAAGLRTAYSTDLIDERLAVAQRCGADWTGNPNQQDVVAEILQAAPGGVDFAFECAGEQETLDQGIELLAPGGALLMVGIPAEDCVRFSAEKMRRKELRFQNVRRQNECVQPAIDLLADGKVDVGPLMTHHFPLAEAKKAFDLVSEYKDGVVKAIIHVSER
ncbi:MAG: alcohol dehydrogenase catalytic domain-containing protein [Planctomycetota bacterium]|nr:alcohol dehydrogenase catalytic domain-containing protein [Planctomycetota bacterium]